MRQTQTQHDLSSMFNGFGLEWFRFGETRVDNLLVTCIFMLNIAIGLFSTTAFSDKHEPHVAAATAMMVIEKKKKMFKTISNFSFFFFCVHLVERFDCLFASSFHFAIEKKK